MHVLPPLPFLRNALTSNIGTTPKAIDSIAITLGLQPFPTKNYNRAISIPSHIIPDSLEMLTNLVKKKVTKILEPYVKKRKERLESYKGLC
jgi:hypothetical protein